MQMELDLSLAETEYWDWGTSFGDEHACSAQRLAVPRGCEINEIYIQ